MTDGSAKETTPVSANPGPPLVVVAGAQTELDLLWLEAVRESAKQSPDKLEEAAKQLITITSLSQGIYFTVVSFSEVKAGLAQLQWTLYVGSIIVFVLPLFAWILSLVFAIRVFKPEDYWLNLNSPSLAEEFMSRVTSYKSGQLQRAYGFLIAGFGLLIIAIAFYFLFLPVAAGK